jgi:hypothetical protein
MLTRISERLRWSSLCACPSKHDCYSCRSSKCPAATHSRFGPYFADPHVAYMVRQGVAIGCLDEETARLALRACDV